MEWLSQKHDQHFHKTAAKRSRMHIMDYSPTHTILGRGAVVSLGCHLLNDDK